MIKFITAAVLSLAAAAAFAAVEANKASPAELESVKGIGSTMATRIVEARKTGPFADWSDLRGRVKGVGTGNAAKFSADGLTVNGKSYASASAPVAKPSAKPAPKAKP